MKKGAIISACGKYRYALSRVWDSSKPLALWIMLNPSTADAELDDPTIRRCIGFSQYWGFGGMLVGNLYAYRSTDKRALYKVADPVGPENVATVQLLRSLAIKTFVAFGADKGPGSPIYQELAQYADPRNYTKVKSEIFCLGHNRDDSPKHPLYVDRKTIYGYWNPPFFNDLK